MGHLDWSPEDQKLKNQSVNSVDWVHGVLVDHDDSSDSLLVAFMIYSCEKSDCVLSMF